MGVGEDRRDLVLRHVLAYPSFGLYPFPVFAPALDAVGRVTGDCTCPPSHPSRDRKTGVCASPGKHPMTPAGYKDATQDPVVLRRLFDRIPVPNVAIAAAPSRIILVDEDPRAGGDETLQALLVEVGEPLPDTWTLETSEKGHHYYFDIPPGIEIDTLRVVSKLGPGLEIKFAGYGCAPPSLHVKGTPYQFLIGYSPTELEPMLGRRPAICPPWLWKRIVLPPVEGPDLDVPPVADSLLGILFAQRGWTRDQRNATKWAVRCPWEDEHTTGATPFGTALFGPHEPGGLGGFDCRHAHCAGRTADTVLKTFSAAERDVANQALALRGITREEVPWPSDADVPPLGGPVTRAEDVLGDDADDHAGDDRADGEARDDASDTNPWQRVLTAPEFLKQIEHAPDWLVDGMLMPGAITRLNSPRGLGKTNIGHAYAVQLARDGLEVLLFDRDNPKSEIRRRLRAWGAEDLQHLLILSREHAPALTDASAWKKFPPGRYKLIVIDSWDASTEGVGEQDSAKPSKAQAVLLDLAHRANGPAVLVLANTTKSGEAGRGAGTLEDREDIVIEVRDATGFTPTGGTDWWLGLPDASRSSWGDRAARRTNTDHVRLAFVFQVSGQPRAHAVCRRDRLHHDPLELSPGYGRRGRGRGGGAGGAGKGDQGEGRERRQRAQAGARPPRADQ
jgi:hypothetical protein